MTIQSNDCRAVANDARVRALAASASRERIADGALVLGVALLALFGLHNGFDTSVLLSGDALYPVQLLDFALLDFRPPPPNRLFPDVGVHWLLSAVTSDPLTQKIAAGLVLFAATAFLVGLYKGPRVFTIVVLVLIGLGFDFADSASHYTLPLLVLLFQLSSRERISESVVLFVIVFSNVLVLLPLAVIALDPAGADRLKARTLVAAAGFGAAAIYSDFGLSFVHLAAVMPFWALALLAARRYGLGTALCVAVCLALLLGGALGLVPARYALPVTAAIAVALTPIGPTRFSWRYVAVPAAIAAIFLATMDTGRARQVTAGFDCVAAALAERGISNIAVDHWTAKPLYFAARARGTPLTLTQTDFAEGDSHPWMAPYAFFGAPTPWALRNAESCVLRKNDLTYCGQATLAPPRSREPICGSFELFRYDVAVPLRFEGRPANKLESVTRQLLAYIAKAVAIAERTLGVTLRR